MKNLNSRKTSYHPMLLVLFRLKILDETVLKQIPASTISYWNSIDHTTQFGFDAVEEYMEKYDDISGVYTSKLVFRFTRFVCRLYKGYQSAIATLQCSRSVLKKAKAELVRQTQYIGQKVSAKFHAKILGLSQSAFHRIKSEVICSKSKLGRCFRTYTTQLSFREADLITTAIEENYDHLPKSTVFYRLRNEGRLFCSLTTFYKYSAGLVKSLLVIKPKREPLLAKRLFEFIHVDITEIFTEQGRMKVAFVKDNFSRAVLNWAILENGKSIQIRNLFEATFEKYNLKEQTEIVSIVSDQGSENKGELLLWIAQQIIPEVKKLTSGIDIKSNSMSESVHHILKNEFGIKLGIPKDREELHEKLIEFVHHHNHIRLPIVHDGYTCQQILNGAVVDKKRFAAQIKEARTKRIESNRSFQCLASVKYQK
jgi:transposase InsO family protein